MSIFKNDTTMTNKNFITAAQMVQTGNIQPQLVENTIRQQLEKKKFKYQYPATVAAAQVHRDATKFGYNRSHQGQPPRVCPCCYEKVQTEKIGLCYATTNIGIGQQLGYEQYKLSSGISLYFSFMKMTITYLLFRFLVSDGFNLITNIVFGQFCQPQTSQKCSPQIWNKLSIINIKENENYLFIQDILHLAVIIFSIIFFFCYRRKQYHIAKVLDASHQTEDTYSILISNIPLIDFPTKKQAKKMRAKNSGNSMQLYHRQHIWKFFEGKIQSWLDSQNDWRKTKGTNEGDFLSLMQKNNGILRSSQIVKSVSLCYNLGNLEILQAERDNLVQNHLLFQQRRKQIENQDQSSDLGLQQIQNDSKFSTIPRQVDFLNDCQIILNKQFASDNSVLFNVTHFVGKAFISFQYEHYRQYILEEAEKNPNFLIFNGVKLSVERASSPEDIYWKNMRHSDSKRSNKMVKSNFVILGALLIAFGIVLGIQILKNQNEKKGLIGIGNTGKYIFVLISSVFIIILNVFLSFLVKRQTRDQRHLTKTNQVLSKILKTVISQFISTSIIIFLVTLILDPSFTTDSGLTLQITLLMLILMFSWTLLSIFPPKVISKSFSFFCKYRNLQPEDTVDKFQVQLNKQFQYAPFQIIEHYIYYLLLILTSSFYAYLVPITTPFLIFFFFMQYWLDKYNMFRRCSLNKKLNYTISRYVLKIFQSSIFLYALGALIFSFYARNQNINIIQVIAFCIALIYLLFLLLAPLKFQRKVFGSYQSSETVMYDDCVADGKFEQTYWSTNPATYLVKETDVTGKKQITNPALKRIFVTG